jgi:DNA uptake protein ComE-like DNA-binding protein
MSGKFQQFWKGYNDYSKGDRNAIIILCVLILISVTATVIVQNLEPKSKYNYKDYEQLLSDWEVQKNLEKSGKVLFTFDPNTIIPEMIDSLDLPESVKRNILNYRKAGGRFFTSSQLRKIYGMNDSIFAAIEKYVVIAEKTDSATSNKIKLEKPITRVFDPNSADYNQLIEFGFNRFQANNVINFRKKAGVFKNKIDLLKIYGIDSTFYRTIENYIQIENVEESINVSRKPVEIDIELNSADSAKLVQLNGIGSVYAKRILKYRELLGGFYSTSQLLEVYNFPEETYRKIEDNISVDTVLIRKIRLNFAEYPDLLRHPYFNKKQVEAVLNYRNKNGSFQDIVQLKSTGIIDSETFSKVRPYLTCR